ncbi:probable inactive receptor kinase At2g26730 [Punica granatum]|uniref:Protein kinase domain-containing protein n=2 Tax=Punica granatum TaxID=22663 RepID=A0A218VZC0_PUNGR|nr:probable inactive receptor kinase At2g26730 [Punica granatum]OWM65381.1 hypothetical protein CDL15_Pgr008971 [Punica granatum]PKI56976.1 hypothetical protein CRG98_022650 [Punica granatum]
MEHAPTWVFLFSVLLIFPGVNSESDRVRRSLVEFMGKLSPDDALRDDSWGWNLTSDPCAWRGIACNPGSPVIRKIVLDGLGLSGIFDPEFLCSARSLVVLSLSGNNLGGGIPREISNCKHLTHLYLSNNRFSGEIPVSMLKISSLRRINISNNNFTGKLPDLGENPDLLSFLAQNNHFIGSLPETDYARYEEFNVSNNNLSGQIPDLKGRLGVDSFLPNPGLCGKPLPNSCPPPLPSRKKSKEWSTDRFLIYLGYAFLGLLVVLFIGLKVVCLRKRRNRVVDDEKNIIGEESTTTSKSRVTRPPSVEFKNGDKSEYSMTSMEGGPSTLVVLNDRAVKDLNFDDLLRAPAELLGRGKHGTLYKVMIDGLADLAVKRIKEWGVSSEDFQWRMKRIDQVKHPNVLAPLAFYCSRQEKLVVYEFQPNGSLFKLLHGSSNEQTFDWGTRLNTAVSIAGALAFMHGKLREDGIAHGGLKSTNILFDRNVDPCISEYGLMMVENTQDYSSSFISQTETDSFGADTYAFGVILLELLTGKTVENSGVDLARWVHSVVREEWTSEVFDRALISEGASEERMVNLLQIALKCVSPSPSERPSLRDVATMVNALKEDDERSMVSELSSTFLASKESGNQQTA